MTKFDYFWRSNPEWVKYENRKFVLKDDAPKEAKESYERYLKQREEATKRGTI